MDASIPSWAYASVATLLSGIGAWFALREVTRLDGNADEIKALRAEVSDLKTKMAVLEERTKGLKP